MSNEVSADAHNVHAAVLVLELIPPEHDAHGLVNSVLCVPLLHEVVDQLSGGDPGAARQALLDLVLDSLDLLYHVWTRHAFH